VKIDRTLKVETAKYAAPLVRDYTALTVRIQEQLRSITPDNFSEGLAMKVKNEVDTLTMRMSFLAVKWIKRSITQVYDEAQGITAGNAKAVGYRKSIEVNHAGNIRKRQERTLAFLNEAAASTRDFTARYIGAIRNTVNSLKNIPAKAAEFDFQDIVNDVILETIELKQSVWFAKSKILSKLLDVVSDAAFVFINGRNYDIRYYVDLVARTELAKAFTDGTKATLNEYGADLVEFSQHANPCAECAKYEGNIYSLSGKSDKYSALPMDAEIPVHPNCGHALLPVADWGNR
jgi:hypothetical protein